MRYVLILTLLAFLGFAGYGIYRNPHGCEKLGLDLTSDLLAIYVVPADVGSNGATPAPEGIPSAVMADNTGASPSVPATPPSPAAPGLPVVGPSSPSLAIATPAPTASKPQYAVGYVATLPAPATPTPQPAPRPAAAPLRGNYPSFNSYQDGLEAAQKNHVPMLVLFTGSDWCPYCQMLEREVLSTSDFTRFSSSKFVFVTIDDLRNSYVADADKSTMKMLEQKFHITGFPTMVVVDENETEKGRTEGYNPGSGPAAVIQQLNQYATR